MDSKIFIYTFKRIAFVGLLGYILPIYLSLYLDSTFSLPKIYFALDHVIGPILFLFGSLLILSAMYRLIKHGEGSPNPLFPPKTLVRIGLYSYIRHPIYFGWIMIVLGAAFYLNSVSMLIFAAFLILFVHFYARREEKELEKRFGNDYLEYKRRVPSLFPKL